MKNISIILLALFVSNHVMAKQSEKPFRSDFAMNFAAQSFSYIKSEKVNSDGSETTVVVIDQKECEVKTVLREFPKNPESPPQLVVTNMKCKPLSSTNSNF
jgi:hypothetical protein